MVNVWQKKRPKERHNTSRRQASSGQAASLTLALASPRMTEEGSMHEERCKEMAKDLMESEYYTTTRDHAIVSTACVCVYVLPTSLHPSSL